MNVRRHTPFISFLIAVLVLSAAAPCDLLEVGDEPLCTTQDARADGAGDEGHAGGLDFDCCAGCLTCCASFTPPPLPAVATRAMPVFSRVSRPVQGPLGSPLSIWRPPRA